MLDLNLSISVIMVARSSSIARAKLPLYFAERFFFFLSQHFLRRRKTDIHENFPHDVA